MKEYDKNAHPANLIKSQEDESSADYTNPEEPLKTVLKILLQTITSNCCKMEMELNTNNLLFSSK